MKTRLLLILLAFLIVSPLAIAQDTTPTTTPAPVVVDGGEIKAIEKTKALEVPVIPEGEVEPSEIAKAVDKAVGDWTALGWLAGVMGICYVLILLTKLKPINEFLKGKGLNKWTRPILAALFGGFAGAATAFAAGVAIPQVIMAGVLAGLSSSGFHELFSVISSKKEREKRS